MWADLRDSWRSFRRSPVSVVAVIVSTALTFGFGTALVALFDRVIFSPPPFHDIESLAVLGEVADDFREAPPRPVAATTWHHWRAMSAPALQIEAYDPTNLTLTGVGHPLRVSATRVSPALLPTLGITPALGRGFAAGDENVTIVSHDFWQSHFRDVQVPTGMQVVLNGAPFTVIGVMPDTFVFPLNPSDLWIPLPRVLADDAQVRLIARFQRGMTLSSAEALLEAVPPGSARRMRPTALAMRTALAGPAHTALPLLLVAVAIAVLLATMNAGAVLLLRSMDGARECAIRAALGARRRDLARRAWAEAHLLLAAGASGGLLIALWATPYVGRVAAAQLGASAHDLTIGWRPILLLGATTLLCASAASVATMIAARRPRALALARREAISDSRVDVLLRRGCAAGELALAFVVLTAMLLVGQSLRQIVSVDPGFSRLDTLSARLSLPAADYPDARSVSAFYDGLHAALASRFGAESIAIVDELPLTGDRGRAEFRADAGAAPLEAVARVAAPGYFSVLGIPVLAGHAFSPEDGQHANRRVVVSGTFARAMFQTEQAAGRTLLTNGSDPLEIVGVVGDVKHRALDERTLPTVYFSAAQQPSRSAHVLVRTREAMSLADALQILRSEVEQRDAELPVYASRTLLEVVLSSPGVAVRRIVRASFSMLALLAITLAAVGVFGVIAHDVGRRRMEIALRLALGASPRGIRRGVLLQASWMLVPGVVVGMMLSVAFSATARSVLSGLDLMELPAPASIATAILAIAAFAAASVPARDAVRSDPARLLRGD